MWKECDQSQWAHHVLFPSGCSHLMRAQTQRSRASPGVRIALTAHYHQLITPQADSCIMRSAAALSTRCALDLIAHVMPAHLAQHLSCSITRHSCILSASSPKPQASNRLLHVQGGRPRHVEATVARTPERAHSRTSNSGVTLISTADPAAPVQPALSLSTGSCTHVHSTKKDALWGTVSISCGLSNSLSLSCVSKVT